MKKIIIDEKTQNQRFDKFLKKYFKNASSGFIYKMLRKKNITLNKAKASGNEILKSKDEVFVFFSDETFDKMRGMNESKDLSNYILKDDPLNIVYENDDFIAINKPKGILSQKADTSDVSLNEYVLSYLIKNKKLTAEDLSLYRPSCVNRLDCNTTGLIFAAKTYKGAKELSEIIRDKSHPKIYRCVCAGEIKEEQLLKHYLVKDEKSNQVFIYDNEIKGAKEIITGIKPLKTNGKVSLLEVTLYTGRTHQIRAHLSYIKHPVIGDYKYGDASANREFKEIYGITSQMLHSYGFEVPGVGMICANMPVEFETIWK